MFRRETAPTPMRPLTGSEMEAAAERQKWRQRLKPFEMIVEVLTLGAVVVGLVFGSKPVKQACDFAIVVLPVLAWILRRKTSERAGN
jgi:hypothetical protein